METNGSSGAFSCFQVKKGLLLARFLDRFAWKRHLQSLKSIPKPQVSVYMFLYHTKHTSYWLTWKQQRFQRFLCSCTNSACFQSVLV